MGTTNCCLCFSSRKPKPDLTAPSTGRDVLRADPATITTTSGVPRHDAMGAQVGPPRRRRPLSTLYENDGNGGLSTVSDHAADYSNPGTLEEDADAGVDLTCDTTANYHQPVSLTRNAKPTLYSSRNQGPAPSMMLSDADDCSSYDYMTVDYCGRSKMPYSVVSAPPLTLSGGHHLDQWNEEALNRCLQGFCYISSEDTVPPTPQAPNFKLVRPHPNARITIVIPRHPSPTSDVATGERSRARGSHQLPDMSGHTCDGPSLRDSLSGCSPNHLSWSSVLDECTASEGTLFEVGLRGQSLDEQPSSNPSCEVESEGGASSDDCDDDCFTLNIEPLSDDNSESAILGTDDGSSAFLSLSPTSAAMVQMHSLNCKGDASLTQQDDPIYG